MKTAKKKLAENNLFFSDVFFDEIMTKAFAVISLLLFSFGHFLVLFAQSFEIPCIKDMIERRL